MKSMISFATCAFLVFLFPGCVSVKSIRESPVRFGFGFEMTPGWQLSESSSSVHALLGYSRINFKGGGGHNNILQLGAQFRSALTAEAPQGFWIGGELSYLNIVNKYDGDAPKQTASGFTIGGLGGYRFLAGKIPVSAYIAPAYLRRGAFKAMGVSGGPGNSGFYGRFGIDIHLMSLFHKKGR